MSATATAPFPVAAGTRLLGEVIAWTCSGVSVTQPALVAALRDAGLDDGVARELAPKHAFTRACRKLCDRRIIRQVGEDEATVKFQFTQESRDGDRYEYALETMLTLDKKTGTVTCDLPGLATLAQEELDRAIEARSGGTSPASSRSCSSVTQTCSRSGPRAGATSSRTGAPRSSTRCRRCSAG